jgi:hypothetical protein
MSEKYTVGAYQAQVTKQGFWEIVPRRSAEFFLRFKVLGRYDDRGVLHPCPRETRSCRWLLRTRQEVRQLRDDLAAAGARLTNLTQLVRGGPEPISLVGTLVEVRCCGGADGQGQEQVWRLGDRRELGLGGVRLLQRRFSIVFSEPSNYLVRAGSVR